MDQRTLERTVAVLGRADVLSACHDEPLSRSAIVERTDRSRATVYRATNDLEAAGLLESTPRGFLTTHRGAVIVGAANRVVDGMTAADRLKPLFAAVDAAELTANAHLLADAELVVATETDQYAANDRAMSLWNESNRVRLGLAAIGSRESILAGGRQMLESDMTVEMCLTPTVLSTFQNLTPELLADVLAAENVTIHVSEEIPFSFALREDSVTISANDESGLPTALAVSTSLPARTWLEGLFEACRADGTPAGDVLERSSGEAG